MKTLDAKSGFTLVEMLMAMLAGAILALTVGSMLVSCYVSWRQNTDSVKLQNDASLAMQWIGNEIRKSNIAEIRIDGTPFDPGFSGSRIDFAANSVRSNATGVAVSGDALVTSDGFELVEDWLDAFVAAFNTDGSVEIGLRLRGGARNDKTRLVGTYFPRN